jgi:hypothetical protein
MMNRRTQSRFSLLLAVVFLGLTATEALAQARRSSGGRSSVGRSRSRSVGASRRSGVRRSAPRSVGRRSSGMRRGSSARRSAPRASVRSRRSRSSGSRVRSRSVGRSSGRRISAPRSSSRGTVRRGTTRRGNSVRSVAPVRTRSSSPVVRNRSAGSRRVSPRRVQPMGTSNRRGSTVAPVRRRSVSRSNPGVITNPGVNRGNRSGTRSNGIINRSGGGRGNSAIGVRRMQPLNNTRQGISTRQGIRSGSSRGVSSGQRGVDRQCFRARSEPHGAATQLLQHHATFRQCRSGAYRCRRGGDAESGQPRGARGHAARREWSRAEWSQYGKPESAW